MTVCGKYIYKNRIAGSILLQIALDIIEDFIVAEGYKFLRLVRLLYKSSYIHH
jgi:hypothetical protein